jgi:hypothetical protein
LALVAGPVSGGFPFFLPNHLTLLNILCQINSIGMGLAKGSVHETVIAKRLSICPPSSLTHIDRQRLACIHRYSSGFF